MKTMIKTIKNYQFYARITEEISDVFWQQARDMNALWNALVELRQNFLEEIKPLYEDKAKNKEALKIKWQQFDKSLADTHNLDEWKEKLGWEAREAILERFRTTSSRALKTGGEIRFKPKRLTQIAFYHRFSNGGMDTEKIFAAKSKKLRLAPVPDELYRRQSYQNRRRRHSKGVFGIGIGDTPLEISVYLHRPIPTGKLKVAQFVGKFDELERQWSWTLVLAIETQEIPALHEFKPAASLDLNWRRFDDYLRIGFLTDTAGNSFEIRLPIEEAPSRRTRNLLRVINTARTAKNKAALDFKDIYPQNILEISDWNERADKLKDTVKKEIKKIYEADAGDAGEKKILTDHAKDFLRFYTKIGRRGLLKLLWQIGEMETPSPDELKVKELLEDWKNNDYRLRLSIHHTYKYLTNKRKKLYENLALWLRRNYSHLIWESDLSLKQMAEQAPKISMNSADVAIKRGNKFRQYAGLSILRGKIKEHNHQNGWLVAVKSANTTRTCHACKAIAETTAELLMQCPNGHITDQDANSCANMLETIPGEAIFSTARETIKVPEHLKKYIVPVVVEV